MPLPPPGPTSTALVTGASAGIGSELARGLARRGHGVTLVARRKERLRELSAELEKDHGVRAEALAGDLAEPAERDRIARELEDRGLIVEVLVNNAGFGIYEPFSVSDRERELQQVRLLVEAVVDLGARYIPPMVNRGRGAVLNVSSTAGFQALPGNGTYAAAKAYTLLHTEALHEELRGTGVTATALCPGPVRSEFQETSKPLFADRTPKFAWRDAKRVAEDGLRALEAGKRSVVPGGITPKVMFAANRLAPARLALPVARRVMSGELKRERSRP